MAACLREAGCPLGFAGWQRHAPRMAASAACMLLAASAASPLAAASAACTRPAACPLPAAWLPAHNGSVQCDRPARPPPPPPQHAADEPSDAPRRERRRASAAGRATGGHGQFPELPAASARRRRRADAAAAAAAPDVRPSPAVPDASAAVAEPSTTGQVPLAGGFAAHRPPGGGRPLASRPIIHQWRPPRDAERAGDQSVGGRRGISVRRHSSHRCMHGLSMQNDAMRFALSEGIEIEDDRGGRPSRTAPPPRRPAAGAA